MNSELIRTVIKLDDPEEKSSKQKSFRKRFAENLNAALNRRGAIPSGYGRVIGVAELFGVSQNTAANWLKGDGVDIAQFPKVHDHHQRMSARAAVQRAAA